MLPEKIPLLEVAIGDSLDAGQLLRRSLYEFRYLSPAAQQPSVALLMPASTELTWRDGDLFPSMDQNLPEGDLFMRIRALFPKQPITPMHLLALIGCNGIGRLGYRLAEHPQAGPAPPISREALLRLTFTPQLFDELVSAYLSTGAGIAGVQPKIMVPDRATVPIPSLIVKAAGSAYPGLAANEYLCLSAAKRAGIDTPNVELSNDGQLLVLDRFDFIEHEDGRLERLGFEDIAALAGLRVRDTLSDRKYQGSYQAIADLLKQLQLPRQNLKRFFEQVAFSVLARNGDAHLKNFGLLYRSATDAWLAPMFDVVTTAIYRYTRYEGGPELEDRTMALKLLRGRHQTRAYPTPKELLAFGRRVCGVAQSEAIVQKIAQAMSDTLHWAKQDERIAPTLHSAISAAWETGLAYASRPTALNG